MKEQKIIHVHCEAAMVKITRLTRAKFPVELKCQLNQKEKIQVLFNQRDIGEEHSSVNTSQPKS